MLKLTFLGTSAGLPTKYRNVTGLAISFHNSFQKSKNKPWILVDCGEATQHQLLKTTLSVMQLEMICITHVHGDHCYGLPGLLASMAMNGRTKPLTIVAPQAINDYLSAVKTTTELMLSFDINFIAIERLKNDTEYKSLRHKLSESHEVIIDIIALSHRTPSHAFKFTQIITTTALLTEKLTKMGILDKRIWGKLQHGTDAKVNNEITLKSSDFVKSKQNQTVLIVAGDNDTPQLLSKSIKDADVLIHEATYTQAIADKRKSSSNKFDPMHSTAKQVADFVENSNLKNLILTHFSARFQPFENPSSSNLNMSHIREEVARNYQGNIWLANDFDEFEIEKGKVRKLNP